MQGCATSSHPQVVLIEIFKTGLWFLQRPRFWGHAVALGYRRFIYSRDTSEDEALATQWARERAVTVVEALQVIGLASGNDPDVPRLQLALLQEGQRLAAASCVDMGGSGDVDLLYATVLLSGAERVVETGVAYGWSSLAVLAAFEERGTGKLLSVDMPYPKLNNEAWVGVAVPERLRSRWMLIREPDRWGLKKALSCFGDTIDLCHYDSDKSYEGREYGFSLMWNALRQGGVLISDDIQDNLAFRDFVQGRSARFAVTMCQGKFVGILRKP